MGRILGLCALLESQGNFNSLMSLFAAFSHAAIGRLKQSFACMAKPAQRMLARLEALLSPTENHARMRSTTRQRLANGQFCMSYLAVLLKDIVSVYNAYNMKLKANDVNWPKTLALDELLGEFMHTQVRSRAFWGKRGQGG